MSDKRPTTSSSPQEHAPAKAHTTLPWVARLAAASGSLAAIALAPNSGQAAVIKVTGSPVSLSLNAGAGAFSLWDVDGVSGADFRLLNFGYTITYNYAQTIVNKTRMLLQSNGLNGRGFVRPDGSTNDNVRRLNSSFFVGPGNSWGTGSNGFRTIMRPDGGIGIDLDNFQQGNNFFGFRFEKSGSLYYGYGIMNFDSANKLVTISSWAYNNVADQPIHVTAFSEAVPGPLGLAGLAAGAGWARKLRRRIRKAN